MFTTKSVSADEENTENAKSQKIFDNWTMAAQIADKTTNYFDADVLLICRQQCLYRIAVWNKTKYKRGNKSRRFLQESKR